MTVPLPRRCAGIVLASLLFGLAASPSAALAQDETARVVAVVTGLFDALARGDTAGMRSFMHAEARIIQTANREGAPWHRVNTLNAFLGSIGGAIAQGRKLEERIFDPEVKIDDNLAQAWARYDFYADGVKSHCGVDSYQIIRTTEGWKILQIVDTQRRPCG